MHRTTASAISKDARFVCPMYFRMPALLSIKPAKDLNLHTRKYKRADGTPVNQLDLWMNTEKEGRRWGRKRNVTVLVKLG